MSPLTETIYEIALRHAEVLKAYGQTEAVLAEGPVLMQNLRAADSAQELGKVHKLTATQVRHEMFGELESIVNTINKMGRNLFRELPANYVKFKSPWPKSGGKQSQEFRGELYSGQTVLIADNLKPDAELYLEHTGGGDLLFFTGVYSADVSGIRLSAGEEATVYLSELGTGTDLSVKNVDERKSGAYLVVAG